MKQLAFLPEVTPSKHQLSCAHCGKHGTLEFYRYKNGFTRKVRPQGWVLSRGTLLCNTCVDGRMKGE